MGMICMESIFSQFERGLHVRKEDTICGADEMLIPDSAEQLESWTKR